MKYRCGHLGCDVCGGRECNGIRLEKFDGYYVCHACKCKAVELAIHVSQSFTTIIDVDRPCGRPPRDGR